MFKPHITVASVVHAEGLLLMVKESINGRFTLNQPAGHLEPGETLVEAAQRELYEETGIQTELEYLLAIHQWIAPDNTPFIRFLFSCELSTPQPAIPRDSDIECCHWLTPGEILNSDNLRSRLVAESIRVWQQGERYPLTILASYQDKTLIARQ